MAMCAPRVKVLPPRGLPGLAPRPSTPFLPRLLGVFFVRIISPLPIPSLPHPQCTSAISRLLKEGPLLL